MAAEFEEETTVTEMDRRVPVCRVIPVVGRVHGSWQQFSVQYRDFRLGDCLIWFPRSTPPELLEDMITDLAQQEKP